ncbi:hypothetical protein PGH47_25740 [Streptomyces sp. HUAS 31]|uniref:hypothetical protein n=1 Tax=Streptomyces sp. HUAS 31 TaxID=3020055 RepID=UPI0023058AEC|nr:hypothetical protein [Streptomyces sp. HUAS 31]WCD98881.1 hypothetical protein PGH47_25740 [Streptomyces sp. HUAS 31]
MAVTGDHNQIVIAPAVRSAYWEQVRRIVPAELVDRQAELSDLAEFCTRDSGPTYAWWRAEAWAGKTALMSWFALNPPPGVRIVPFFVTAQLRSQNDAVAYGDVVLEQLAELAGDSLPAHLTEATRDGHLLRLYSQAARICLERGERLVLLVDGLDEDRGVTMGPDAHSIASLLPRFLEFGTRVIVSGRLNPPLPSDVPHDHPLRDSQHMRSLRPSPHAQAIRAEAERELKRFLAEGHLCRDLLGFVVAAEGGLTASDLGWLTGQRQYEIEDLLRNRAGRTFVKREASSLGSSRAGLYLLAHEELKERAEEMLGAGDVDRYRQHLHAWCDEYREQRWPPETPHYLLRGYFQMVHAQGDIDRVILCAVDPHRHERLLHASGHDASALAEIGIAGEMIIEEGGGRLHDMLRLSIRRNALEERISKVPPAIAAAWGHLGEGSRGEMLARGFPDRTERAVALAEVGEVLGGLEAVRLLGEAEQLARQAGDEVSRDAILVRIVLALVKTRHFARAERLAADLTPERVSRASARGIIVGLAEAGATDLVERMAPALGISDEAPVHLAVALAAGGSYSKAEVVARGAHTPTSRKVALARLASVRRRWADGGGDLIEEVLSGSAPLSVEELAPALASAGELEAALALVKEVTLDEWRFELISKMVGESAWFGYMDHAKTLLRLLPDGDHLSAGAASAVLALCRDGDLDQAFSMARLITTDVILSEALLVISLAMIRAGQTEEALRIGRILVTDSGSIDPLIRISVELAASGSVERAREVLLNAEELARRSMSAPAKLRNTAAVAQALARAGFVDAAQSLLARTEHDLAALMDQTALDTTWLEELVVCLAKAMAWAGLSSRAEELAKRLHNAQCQERIWAEIAKAMSSLGRFEEAEGAARTPLKLGRSRLPGLVAVALAADGEFERAVGLARGHADVHHDAWVLAEIAGALHAAGRHQEAKAYIAEAEEIARGAPAARTAASLVRVLVLTDGVTAARSQLGQAEAAFGRSRVAGSDDVSHMACAMAAVGDFDRAEALIDRALGPSAQAVAQARLVEAYVLQGEYQRAEAMAGRIRIGREAAGAYLAIARSTTPERSRICAALALHRGWWPLCLPELLNLEPTTADIAVEAIEG